MGEAINWDMNEAEIGIKCGSLINWPHCEQEAPQGQGRLDQFLVKQSPTSVVISIASEKELLQGQTVYLLVKFNHDKRKEEADYLSREFSYVQFDAKRNKYFAADKLHITKEKQEWLASRAKDVVVITPSLDEAEVLPLYRLKNLFSHFPKTAHVFPQGFTDLKSDESISRCSEEEQVFAVMKRSPGFDNLCDTDIVYLEKTSIEDVCYQEDILQQIDNEPESVPMELDGVYEPQLMDIDADVPTTSDGRGNHGLVHYCREIIRKQERSQLTIDRLLQGEESLQKPVL
ncbi:unnamed protein product [Cylicocyclus nassatus]|uniref:Uncharacterized protein n=1 Tax=Cylicocyclus nassatus TaxID=53992 RepID=A0AA36GH34_CYLNA|nr:unnamed protein product [Cylicocyclus nassatus]